MSKLTVGLIEPVILYGQKMKVKALAKFDTGAQRTSVDSDIADKIQLGPVVKFVRVKSATAGKHSYVRRPVFRAEIEIHGKRFPIEINIAERSHLNQKVLIGRDVIYGRFVIDIEKTHKSHVEDDVREE